MNNLNRLTIMGAKYIFIIDKIYLTNMGIYNHSITSIMKSNVAEAFIVVS